MKINFGKWYHCMTHQILHPNIWTVYKYKFKIMKDYSSCLCRAWGAHKFITISRACMCHQIVVTVTTIPYQMRSSYSDLRKANLPATWLIFFKWLISFLSVIGKIHYNGGMGWWPYMENNPPTSNGIFCCPEIFFSYYRTISLSFRNTTEVAIQNK